MSKTQCRVGMIAFSSRTLSLLAILALAFTLEVASPIAAIATPITYDISPAIAVTGSWATTISGSFVYDPDTSTYSSVDFAVTGGSDTGNYITVPSPSSYAGGFLSSSSIMAEDSTDGSDGHYVYIVFDDSLSSTSSDLVDYVNFNLTSNFDDESPTDGAAAVPSALLPAPEPPSLALLGSALGLLALTWPLGQRDRRV